MAAAGPLLGRGFRLGSRLRLLRPRSVLAEETYVSKRNTISHNYMLEGNLAVGGYAALLLYESGENVIVHNTIKR